MKNNNKIIAGITSAVAVSLIVYVYVHKKNCRKKEEKLNEIADAGYETAHDILFPLRRNLQSGRYRFQ